MQRSDWTGFSLCIAFIVIILTLAFGTSCVAFGHGSSETTTERAIAMCEAQSGTWTQFGCVFQERRA